MQKWYFKEKVDSLFLQFLQEIQLLKNSGYGEGMYIIFARRYGYHLSVKDVHPFLSTSSNASSAWRW